MLDIFLAYRKEPHPEVKNMGCNRGGGGACPGEIQALKGENNGDFLRLFRSRTKSGTHEKVEKPCREGNPGQGKPEANTKSPGGDTVAFAGRKSREKMSAYIVTSEVISATVELFMEKKRINNPDFLCKQLYLLNVEAVRQRYKYADSPGEYAKLEEIVYKPTFTHKSQKISAAICLKYQCTEGNVFHEPLYRALEKIIFTAEKELAAEMNKSREWFNQIPQERAARFYMEKHGLPSFW